MFGVHTGNVYIGMETLKREEIYLVEDSPTDFAYQTFLDVLEKRQQRKELQTSCRLGYVQGGEYTLQPGETLELCWSLVFADNYAMLKQELDKYRSQGNLHMKRQNERQAADFYWQSWMQEGREISGEDRITEAAKINLVFNESSLCGWLYTGGSNRSLFLQQDAMLLCERLYYGCAGIFLIWTFQGM